MTTKKVSKRYALNEFYTVGLILIIYCLFVLFIPLVLDQLFSLLFEDLTWNGIDLILAAKTILMIIGTILPFGLLKLATRRKGVAKAKKLPMTFSQVLCQALVFFTVTSAAIFISTALASYFGLSGELVSGIGISIDSSKLTDVVYVVTFILISPILEEYAFRGVLLNVLSKYGKYFALYASAVVFSLAHGSFMEFLPSFIMAILLGKIALRYKSIKPTIWIHILFNLFLYLSFIIPEKFSMIMAGAFALIYIISIALYLTGVYQPIIVKKSNSNSKVTVMFLTTFTVMSAMILSIAHSVLTIILK